MKCSEVRRGEGGEGGRGERRGRRGGREVKLREERR